MQNLGLGGLNDSPVTGKLVSRRTGTHTLTPSLGSATSGMRDSPGSSGNSTSMCQSHVGMAVAPGQDLLPRSRQSPGYQVSAPPLLLRDLFTRHVGTMAATAANSEL